MWTLSVSHPAKWLHISITAEKDSFLNRFLGFKFLGFNLQMPDTKLRPTNTMKSKDKYSEQRFGHVKFILWTPQIAIRIWISFLLN